MESWGQPFVAGKLEIGIATRGIQRLPRHFQHLKLQAEP
jgi:hypothetical protein